MPRLTLQIKALDIKDKDNSNCILKLSDSKASVPSIQFKYEETKECAVDIDVEIMHFLANIMTFQIFDTVSNKDGSITENVFGTTKVDLTHFLYGEMEMTVTDTIQSVVDETNSDINDIGTITLHCAVSDPIFTDKEVDGNNYLQVEILEMNDIPKPWIDPLISNETLKHWLECEWQLFDQILSFNINILQKNSPKLMPSEKQNDDETEENRYCIHWDFKSKYVLTECDMNTLIKAFKNEDQKWNNSRIQVVHKYQQMDENQAMIIKQDSNYLFAQVDIASLFDASEYKQCVSLGFEKDTDQDTVNNTTIDIKLCFDTSFKSYCEEMERSIQFKDIISSSKTAPNTTEYKTNDLSTEASVNEIVELLVHEYNTFMAKTNIQRYDEERISQGFTYHLNSTGLYHDIKEKWMKPEILKYIQQMNHPLSTMFQTVLGSMISNLSQTIQKQTATQITSNPSSNTNQQSIQKHTQIAKDFELQRMMSDAYKHYQMAFDLSQDMRSSLIHWNAVQNFTKVLIKQTEIEFIDQAISILTHFLSNQPNHNECLFTLCAVLIENKHENAKPVTYQLCSQQLNVASLLLKTAYFARNNDVIRRDIHFKQALKLCDNTTQPLQEPLNALLDLQCVDTVSILLDQLQAFEQIDIHFHTQQAKLHTILQRFGTANASIDEAIQINDEESRLWAIKGHIEYASDKHDKANQCYIKHLQLLPGTAESLLPPQPDIDLKQKVDRLSLYRVAQMYLSKNDYEQALQAFTQGIGCNADSWLFWNGAGDSWYHLKDYTQAIHCFEQSNMIHVHHSHAWCMLALCYLAINKPKPAIQIMQEAIKFDTISAQDKDHITSFGQTLMNKGYVQSGALFKHFI
eukprot:424410_1